MKTKGKTVVILWNLAGVVVCVTWTLQRNQRLQPGVLLLFSLNQGLKQVHVQNVTFLTFGTTNPLLNPLLAHADAVVVRLYHNEKRVLVFFCGVLQVPDQMLQKRSEGRVLHVPLAAVGYCVSGGHQNQQLVEFFSTQTAVGGTRRLLVNVQRSLAICVLRCFVVPEAK
jgi:hypothetical protein